MPELPDVQVFKEYLDSTSLHQRIDDVTVAADRILDNVSARTLRSRLRRKSLVSTQRHGKHLFVEIEDDAWLRLHFGMTGKL
jgi:formamidopyrimidine-DNA glycosylase